MDNLNSELITIDELCEALMIGKNAAYKLLSSGQIKSFRLGRKWKIPRDSIVVARRFCPCLAQDICQKLLPCFAA